VIKVKTARMVDCGVYQTPSFPRRSHGEVYHKPGRNSAAVGGQKIEVCSLYQVLREVTDSRKKRGRRYEAAVVLTIMVLAKMAGEVASPRLLDAPV
jgi:hypothetical protein